MAESALWLFGYGSIIWRPDFPYIQKRVATIEGFARRFWQGSNDHRGVPGAPGRVVTLIPAAGERCTGVAFQVDQRHKAAIFNQLDYREKNGYERLEVDCELDDGERVASLTYVAGLKNEAFLGEAPLEQIAWQINSSLGPSGANRDYLLELASALRELKIDDEHVFALEALVLKTS